MEEELNIYQKLTNVQCELKAPKGQYNRFGKYAYRSCEDILEALKPLLSKYGLNIYITDKIITIEGKFFVESTITVTDVDNSPSPKVVVTGIEGHELEKKGMDFSQITGAASSYARKYALNGLFLIDDTKDADATNDHGKAPGNPEAEKARARLVNAINEACKANNLDPKTEMGKVAKRKDFKHTAEFFNMVADEYEGGVSDDQA